MRDIRLAISSEFHHLVTTVLDFTLLTGVSSTLPDGFLDPTVCPGEVNLVVGIMVSCEGLP